MHSQFRFSSPPQSARKRCHADGAGLARSLRAAHPVGSQLLLLAGLYACSGGASLEEPVVKGEELSARHGKDSLFDEPFPHSNGRSCASCHVRADHTTLQPAHVEELQASDPEDPLFNAIDADDPAAAELGYEHLKKGLVRVLLQLADNVDVIDAAGTVITPADRQIAVWRGVPSVENTAISAPYQYDGRAATLQAQAQGAVLAHSQGPLLKDRALDALAELEESLFSSERARFVFDRLERGVALEQIPSPEAGWPLAAREQRGREVFEAGCAPCHGGATTHHIVDQAVHDGAFFQLGPDGYVRFEVTPGQPPVPVPAVHANDDFLPGYGILSYLGQLGAFPAFNASVELPRYRLRFYTDGTRQEAVAELPPALATLSGDPADPQPALDARGAPLVGPNFVPQAFSTDPGRAAITGNPLDFEAIDVPQLRGIAHTAPYFHDNSAGALTDVVDVYSRFVLGALPSLKLPPVHPPETPFTPPEALSPAQKQDLLAFLQRL
jgi:cytochrome c peroxidase